MSLKNKLNRLKPHLKSGVEKPKAETVSVDENSAIPFFDVWEKENTAPFYFDGQYCLVREIEYPLDYRHGDYQFADFLEAVSLWNKEIGRASCRGSV